MKLRILFSLLAATWTASAEQPASVRTVEPLPAPATDSVRLPARTAPEERADIYSRATGIVRERKVDIGDSVRAGDVLAILDAPEIDRQIERARAALETAKARADLANRALLRARTMSKERVIAAEALDEREAEARTSAAEVDGAAAELGRLETLRSFLTIRAPFDGVIAARRVDRGDHIAGDQFTPGDALFTIVRLDTLRVEIDAPPSSALRIAPNQTATVEFGELPGEKFPAKVSRASGIIDNRSGTMRVELEMPNPENRIPSGLTGTAFIQLPPDKIQRLLVPTNALVTREGAPHVAKVKDGRIAFAKVVRGKNLGNAVEVLDGVSRGEQLVVSPNSLLREGDPVTVSPAR